MRDINSCWRARIKTIINLQTQFYTIFFFNALPFRRGKKGGKKRKYTSKGVLAHQWKWTQGTGRTNDWKEQSPAKHISSQRSWNYLLLLIELTVMDPKISADMLFVTQAFLIQFSQEWKERCKLQNLTLDHDQLHRFPSNISLAPNWVPLRMLSPWPSAAKEKTGVRGNQELRLLLVFSRNKHKVITATPLLRHNRRSKGDALHDNKP